MNICPLMTVALMINLGNASSVRCQTGDCAWWITDTGCGIISRMQADCYEPEDDDEPGDDFKTL
jgi:hypothetical protein